MRNDFDQYYEVGEPGQREKASAWATAIGLQDVDGLKPSKYLIETAKRNIEGEITATEARKLIDEYYETKNEHDIPDGAEEADKVAVRINQIIHTPAFRLSPEFLLSLHGKIFDGVFPHAGKIREVDMTKREWVLNGDTVQYEFSFAIEKSLSYDFDREAKFSYGGLSEERFIEHFAAFISGIWQIHPFREGNTRTIAVFAIKYLRSKGFKVENDLFKDKSFYFRNALVRANYENVTKGVEKTILPLEEFFKVLVYGDSIELHNRFLRIGQEYGTVAADKIAKLHRNKKRGSETKEGDVTLNVPLNVTLKERVLELVRANPGIKRKELSGQLNVTVRTISRILSDLSDRIEHRGSKKTGGFYAN